jgi:hypothetical protein
MHRPHRPEPIPPPPARPHPASSSDKAPICPNRGGSAAPDRTVAGGLAGVQGLGPMGVVKEKRTEKCNYACFTHKIVTNIIRDANLQEVFMTPDDVKARIIACLPRDLMIDLFDDATARARQAYDLVANNTDLSGKSARGLEGQARYRLMEKGFESICAKFGALRLEGDIIPGTELRCFQPFMRFGGTSEGVVFGLASMPVRSELPTKNQSRSAGVTLNYHLTPRLDLEVDGRIAKPGDVFALMLFARDPSKVGALQEVAIGVIDSNFKSYLVYIPIEEFLTVYVTIQPDAGTDAPPTVKLKKSPVPYRPPEESPIKVVLSSEKDN